MAEHKTLFAKRKVHKTREVEGKVFLVYSRAHPLARIEITSFNWLWFFFLCFVFIYTFSFTCWLLLFFSIWHCCFYWYLLSVFISTIQITIFRFPLYAIIWEREINVYFDSDIPGTHNVIIYVYTRIIRNFLVNTQRQRNAKNVLRAQAGWIARSAWK